MNSSIHALFFFFSSASDHLRVVQDLVSLNRLFFTEVTTSPFESVGQGRHCVETSFECVIVIVIVIVKQDAVTSRCDVFDMLSQSKMPTKKSRKGSAKGQVALRKEYMQLGCASQDSQPRKSLFYGKQEHWEQSRPTHSPKAFGTR